MASSGEKRRRWMIAGAVSAAAHVALFLILNRPARFETPPPPPPIEITLERRAPPEPPPDQATQLAPRRAVSRSFQRPAEAPPAQVQPSPFAAGGGTGAPAAGAPAAGAAPSNGPVWGKGPLTLDCIERGPGPRTSYGREACEPRRFATPGGDGAPGRDPVDGAWAAAAAAKEARRRPLPPEQPNRNACANANLGLGCTEDMLIPLVKRKF